VKSTETGVTSEELAYSNWTILLPGVSPTPECTGIIRFSKLFFLLTYLLTSLFGTYPQILGSLQLTVTKLRGLNDSPLGVKLPNLGEIQKYLILLPVQNAIISPKVGGVCPPVVRAYEPGRLRV